MIFAKLKIDSIIFYSKGRTFIEILCRYNGVFEEGRQGNRLPPLDHIFL